VCKQAGKREPVKRVCCVNRYVQQMKSGPQAHVQTGTEGVCRVCKWSIVSLALGVMVGQCVV